MELALGSLAGLTSQESLCSFPSLSTRWFFDLVKKRCGQRRLAFRRQRTFFVVAPRSSRLDQTRRCDGVGGRPRMTEGLFMYLFGSRFAIYSRCILLKWSAIMSGHPPQRRQTNVGSLLLTPQENECLFNCLGRKCIVSFSIKFCDSELSMLMQLTSTGPGGETGS